MTYDVQAHIDNRLAGPIPKGRHVVRQTLKLTQSYGYKLWGEGGVVRNEQQALSGKGHSTVIIWEGPDNEPVFDISGNTGLVYEGINILARNASQGILLRDAGGSLNIAFRDFGIIGGTVGIQFGETEGDQTCANITQSNVHHQEQREACIRVCNTQSVEHALFRPSLRLAPIGIDVRCGGDIAILGGGSYELGTLLKIGKVGRNCRGFRVDGFRLDGKTTRTVLVEHDDPKSVKSVGQVVFSSCRQNAGQLNSDKPLLTVCPGMRAVLREFTFDGRLTNLFHVWSDRYGHQKVATGELIVENSDGLDGTSPEKLASLVTLHGERAYAEFKHCGTLWAQCNSWSNFPDQLGGNGTVNPPQFTADEVDALRRLLQSEAEIALSVETAERIRDGQLRTVLAEVR